MFHPRKDNKGDECPLYRLPVKIHPVSCNNSLPNETRNPARESHTVVGQAWRISPELPHLRRSVAMRYPSLPGRTGSRTTTLSTKPADCCSCAESPRCTWRKYTLLRYRQLNQQWQANRGKALTPE